jgi:hypothetical protein
MRISKNYIATTQFTEALFTIAKIWKQSKFSSTDEWIKKCDLYVMWNIIQA